MRSLWIILLAVLVPLTAWSFNPDDMGGQPPDVMFAQGPGGFDPGQPPGGGPEGSNRREDVARKIETLKKWRMLEELGLDEETANKFLPAISSLEQKRRDLGQQSAVAMRELREYLRAGNPDEGKLKKALERLEKAQTGLNEMRAEEIKAVREHLSVEQQARYVVFQQEFQREVREMIMRARGGREPGFEGRERPRMPGGEGFEGRPPAMRERR